MLCMLPEGGVGVASHESTPRHSAGLSTGIFLVPYIKEKNNGGIEKLGCLGRDTPHPTPKHIHKHTQPTQSPPHHATCIYFSSIHPRMRLPNSTGFGGLVGAAHLTAFSMISQDVLDRDRWGTFRGRGGSRRLARRRASRCSRSGRLRRR